MSAQGPYVSSMNDEETKDFIVYYKIIEETLKQCAKRVFVQLFYGKTNHMQYLFISWIVVWVHSSWSIEDKSIVCFILVKSVRGCKKANSKLYRMIAEMSHLLSPFDDEIAIHFI